MNCGPEPAVPGAMFLTRIVPVSFMGGITGQLYRQFALTVSISVILSVIVALTLTPALCSMLLRPRKEIRGPVGAFLRGFNTLFNKVTNGYLGGVAFSQAGEDVLLVAVTERRTRAQIDGLVAAMEAVLA